MLAAGSFGEYDEDDREVDEIWDTVDQQMDMRRRDRRERRLKEELRNSDPKSKNHRTVRRSQEKARRGDRRRVGCHTEYRRLHHQEAVAVLMTRGSGHSCFPLD